MKRLRKTFIAIVLSMVMLLGGSLHSAEAQTQVGQWGAPFNIGLNAIHMMPLNNGWYSFSGGNTQGQQGAVLHYRLYNSATNAVVNAQQSTGVDTFCTISAYRPELNETQMFGGDIANAAGVSTNVGNNNIVGMNNNGTIANRGTMDEQRWYATSFTMPNGDIFVIGGKDGGEDYAELLRRGSNETIALLNMPTATIMDNAVGQGVPYGNGWWYPRTHLGNDGSILMLESGGDLYRIAPNLSGYTHVGSLGGYIQPSFSMVEYSPGMFLVHAFTTAANGQQRGFTWRINWTNPNAPVITEIQGPAQPRMWADMVLLPDGRVLLTGGNNGIEASNPANNNLPLSQFKVQLNAEIWNPANGVWSNAGTQNAPRLYHSTSTLLPDGRVLTAGGGANGPVLNKDAQAWTPNYLLNNPSRPNLTQAHGAEYVNGQNISVPVTGQFSSQLVLMAAGSVTHSMNTHQRRIVLPTTRTTQGGVTTLNATIPSNLVATPGLYQLIAMGSNGVPSVAKMVEIDNTGFPRSRFGFDPFVSHLYETMFSVAPIVAYGNQWTAYTTANGRGATLQQFAQDYTYAVQTGTDPYNNNGYVVRLFLAALDRYPTPAEFTYHVTALANGYPRLNMATDIAYNPELANFGL